MMEDKLSQLFIYLVNFNDMRVNHKSINAEKREFDVRSKREKFIKEKVTLLIS